jgi:hypothetical protein
MRSHHCTSMAAVAACGAIVHLLQARPNLTPGQVKALPDENGLQTLLSLAGRLVALPARMVFAGPAAALNSASRCSVAFTFWVCVRAPASLGIMTHENPANTRWIRSHAFSQEILACGHGITTIGKTGGKIEENRGGSIQSKLPGGHGPSCR